MVRLTRGADADRFASRRSRGGKIVHRDEVASEVEEQDGEPDRIGTRPHRPKRLASDRNRSLRLTARVFDLGEVERRNALCRGCFRASGALCAAARTSALPSRDRHETGLTMHAFRARQCEGPPRSPGSLRLALVPAPRRQAMQERRGSCILRSAQASNEASPLPARARPPRSPARMRALYASGMEEQARQRG